MTSMAQTYAITFISVQYIGKEITAIRPVSDS